MTRPTRSDWAMNMVDACASRTTCIRGHGVGCVLLDARGHVLATGNNGVPSGDRHCNEVVDAHIYTYIKADAAPGAFQGSDAKGRPLWFAGKKDTHPYACTGHADHIDSRPDACRAIHAEQNALLQCRDVNEIEVCYTSLSPCVHCVKLLRNTSCGMIIFKEPYTKHYEEALRIWCGDNPTKYVGGYIGDGERQWLQYMEGMV